MTLLSTEEGTAQSRLLGGTTGLLPRVNLLPPEIAERRAFRQVQMGMGAAVGLVLVVMGAVTMSASRGVSAANEELADSRTENTRLTAQARSFQNVTALYAAADASQAQLVAAMGTEVRFSQLLNDLSLTIPSSVWVQSVSMTTDAPGAATAPTGAVGTFQVTGTGFSHNDVGLWLEAVAGLKTYANPYFSTSAEGVLGPRKIVTFTSTADLTAAARSGRYTTPAGG